jgi:hypothetical protein
LLQGRPGSHNLPISDHYDEDWAGGGYGKHKGLALREIRQRFAKCEDEPSMRSISAVLRITREQLEARGQLGSYPVLAIGGFAILAIALVALPFTHDDVHALLEKTVYGSAAVAVLLTFGAVRVRHARKSNLAQEDQIRSLAVATLNAILAKNPKLKPLEREQVATVKELMKKVKGSGQISSLLEVS